MYLPRWNASPGHVYVCADPPVSCNGHAQTCTLSRAYNLEPPCHTRRAGVERLLAAAAVGTPGFAARVRACVHAVLEPLGLSARTPTPGGAAPGADPGAAQSRGAAVPHAQGASAGPGAPAAAPSGAAAGGWVGGAAGLGLLQGLAPAERGALLEAAALPQLLEGAAWAAVAAKLARRGAPAARPHPAHRTRAHRSRPLA